MRSLPWSARECANATSAGTRAAATPSRSYESTLQIFTRFAEDYLVEPDGDETLFTWTLAIEPRSALTLPIKALAPVIKAAFGRMPSDGQRYFAKRSIT